MFAIALKNPEQLAKQSAIASTEVTADSTSSGDKSFIFNITSAILFNAIVTSGKALQASTAFFDILGTAIKTSIRVGSFSGFVPAKKSLDIMYCKLIVAF